MAKEEMEERIQDQPEKKKNTIIKVIIIAVICIAVLAALAIGGIYMWNKLSAEKKPAVQPKPLMGLLWPMDPFIVNLADNQGERYMKIILQLEVPDQETISELEQLKPKLRDHLLDLLSSKTLNELVEVGGKQKLRDEIVLRLNAFLIRGKILRVYFTEFVIQ